MPSILQCLKIRDLTFYKRCWFVEESRPRGKVLDMPAGEGRDSKMLHELGYKVIPADLFPESFKQELNGVECVQADMTGPFPFEDNAFDYLLNSEGIEHLADQFSFLEKCNRILKPGGKLIITTPNLLSIRSRLALALNGNRAFKSFADEYTSVWGFDGKRIYHGHVFLVNYFQLRYMLWHTGFKISEVVNARYSLTSVLMTPLVPLMMWFTRKAIKKARKKNPKYNIYPEIWKHVFSRAMLYSSNLFLVAEKLTDEERQGPKMVPYHARKCNAYTEEGTGSSRIKAETGEGS